MIGDKITVNGKDFIVKKDITVGEYRKINSISNKLNQLSQKYGSEQELTKLQPDELAKITTEFSQTSEEQLNLMVDFLKDVLGITQDDVDKLSLNEATTLFAESFKSTTTVKKTSNQIYT